ncbi:hypothetical protein Ddye_024091 [Dipteronia dyeriana]|uniref:Uncharacterized protein n=1 Tax=Dipteronia dyeriana TaxID=168575 RepID=A0AAD9TUS2_9ROSI|nr:hypothetical protein Ddye_024091 [Dipteronia dyeriana]
MSGVWYVDAEELEKRVCGGREERKKRVVVNFKEVERKRELGERLLWQYVVDYKGSRGQTGDIKMFVATQRSETAADKVSAFSVMVVDNSVANLRSLDGLFGMVSSKVGKRHALTGFEALKELFISRMICKFEACSCLFKTPIAEELCVKNVNGIFYEGNARCLNMVVQNESADDDDLEHFEDIVEETKNEPSTAPKKEENNDFKTVNTIKNGTLPVTHQKMKMSHDPLILKKMFQMN